MGEDKMRTVLGRLAARQAVRGDSLVSTPNATAVRGEGPGTKARIDNSPSMRQRSVTVVRGEGPETAVRGESTIG